MKISSIKAREIYSGTGFPALQCEITLTNGQRVKASAPLHIMNSSDEPIELHDGSSQIFSQHIAQAIEYIETHIAPHLIGQEPHCINMDHAILSMYQLYDNKQMTSNANFVLSMALYKAHALIETVDVYELIAFIMNAQTVSLPAPIIQIASQAGLENHSFGIKEVSVLPVGVSRFRNAFEYGVMTYHEFQALIKATPAKNDHHLLDLLTQALVIAEKKYGATCVIGITMNAQEKYDKARGLYFYDNTYITTDDLFERYTNLIKQYPVYAIENPFYSGDIYGWHMMNKKLDQAIQVVANNDALIQTDRIGNKQEQHIASAYALHTSHEQTVTTYLQKILLLKDVGIAPILSSGCHDTIDTFIAEVALGCSATQVKFGPPCGSQHVEKYNKLISLEDDFLLNEGAR